MKKLVYKDNLSDYGMHQWVVNQCRYYGWDFYTNFQPEYDLGINYLGTKLITKEELNKAPWINFHPAPLPEYGGRNLAYHAIMNNASRFGATIHYMDEGFDTGPIIDVDTFPVKSNYTAQDLIRISYEQLRVLAYKYIPKFLRGEIVPSYPNMGGNYYKKQTLIDEIYLSSDEKQRVRALYCPPYYPYILIEGRKYWLKADE